MSKRSSSLSLRIRVAFLLLGLIAITLTGALALHIAEESLETATYERLTGIRETKRRQVETHLLQAVSLAAALGRDESVIDATLGFEAAWPPEGAEYQAVRSLHEDGLKGLAAAMGFEDLLLIKDGLVLYTVGRGAEAGRRIDDLGAPTLRTVYQAIVDGADAQLTEYGPYANPAGVAAFAVAPIADDGMRLGVIAARLSIGKLDEIMTGGGRWRSEGLGETGETYLVGEDLLMRSDSRFLTASPEKYFSQLSSSGVSAGQVEQIRSRGTTVLTQSVDTPAVRRALAGESGLAQVSDYRGVTVLSAYAPLEIPGPRWVLLSEIDAEEAFAPIADLRLQTVLLGLTVSSAFLGLGYVFSQRTTRPLLALTRSVERFGSDDWQGVSELEAFQTADDEVARLALQFDQVSRRLQETTVSRDYLDDLLASMLNAVFTIGPVDAELSSVKSIRVRSANPAAVRLLGYGEGEELRDLPLTRLLGQGDGAAGWLPTLVTEGHTPTIKSLLMTKDGKPVPVLLAAARLRSRPADEHSAVCVAQDITDLRNAERRLQALNRRLIHAQEEERSRLARELHDDVTQRLGGLAIEIGSLAREGGPHLRELNLVKERAIQLADDVQGLSRRLHPSILDDLGLAAALRAEAAAARSRLGIPVSLAVEDLPPEFPKSSALSLYRIAQECLQNVAKYARASEVNIELVVSDHVVRLRIEDDGVGFDSSRTGGGLGITSMQERARLAGGRLSIRTAPGRGVKISVEMPVALTDADSPS